MQVRIHPDLERPIKLAAIYGGTSVPKMVDLLLKLGLRRLVARNKKNKKQ